MDRRPRDEPPAVIRSIVENLRSFWQLRAEPGPAESEGIIWWTSGGQRRPMNGVLALTAADPGPVTDRIAATFRLSGLPCAWTEGPDPASPELGLRLLGLGYQALEGSRGWALPLEEARQGGPEPEGLIVRHGRETELLVDLTELVGTGTLHLGTPELSPLTHLLRPRELGPESAEEIWIGLADGAPSAGLLLHPYESTVGVFALTTAPERRGQGYASALLRSALRESAARGFRWAVAEATESHAGPLRRLGFDEFCDFRRYGWEPRGDPPPSV